MSSDACEVPIGAVKMHSGAVTVPDGAASGPRGPIAVGLQAALKGELASRFTSLRARMDSACLILPGLYLGNVATAHDSRFLRKRNIGSILTVAPGLGDLSPIGLTVETRYVSVPSPSGLGAGAAASDDPDATPAQDSEARGTEPARKKSDGEAKGGTIDNLVLDMRDDSSTHLAAYLPLAFAFIDDGLASGDSAVLVHCRAGVSRSASVCIAYVMREREISYSEALEHVRRSRPCVLPNPGFAAQLKAWVPPPRLGGAAAPALPVAPGAAASLSAPPPEATSTAGSAVSDDTVSKDVGVASLHDAK